ncbi:hypothetical protein ONZ51_g11619 [Trametes cubensis]|uniref:Uncharacterized protein n=1 Tax=Trametes cubensis TaxID=1111947 RepID=A0AAD7THV4_9APHY|nr:hypothetical protein ONZ51_g11619 [Trametes cubensis]
MQSSKARFMFFGEHTTYLSAHDEDEGFDGVRGEEAASLALGAQTCRHAGGLVVLFLVVPDFPAEAIRLSMNGEQSMSRADSRGEGVRVGRGGFLTSLILVLTPLLLSVAVKLESTHSATLAHPIDGLFDYEKALRNVFKWLVRHQAQKARRHVEHLRVASVGAAVSYQHTLRSSLNPLNVVHNIYERCSLEEFHSVQGEVSYDSLAPEQIEKHYRGNVQYCPKDDVHFPTCTSRRARRLRRLVCALNTGEISVS